MQTRSTNHHGPWLLALCVSTVLIASCGSIGDTGSIKKAGELAIECRTDEALAALDNAETSGGFSKYMAGLERVGILRDAGRSDEAAKALRAYKSHPEVASSSDEEIEESLTNFVDELRKKRKQRTGSSTCPG